MGACVWGPVCMGPVCMGARMHGGPYMRAPVHRGLLIIGPVYRWGWGCQAPRT
jgi:hypothetical protein